MHATGINDLNLLVKTIVQGEEKNFALFKFVNELNSEIENFETQIFEMQSEIDRNLAEGGQNSQKRQRLQELQTKLNKTKSELIDMEIEQRQNAEKITKIKDCISKIFKVIECDDSQNKELLGG